MISGSILPLELALSELRQAYLDDPAPAHRSPYFFIAGAGVSAPNIPLARDIIQHCQARATAQRKDAAAQSSKILDEYSTWFERAYPHREQRQRYLRGLLQPTAISHANLHLAHILASKRLTNVLVTPNFDDHLSRALTLFGEPHISCDHPLGVQRITHDSSDIQLVHVHGTFWYYDCCNLRDEVLDRANASTSTTSTMASLLDRLLAYRSPLVLGYAGWDGDVIMTALRRRLTSPLRFRMYWFCFRRQDFDQLPSWLKENPDVRFVLPPEIAGTSPEEPDSERPRERVSLPNEAKADPSLPAAAVLRQLIRAFDLEPPALTKDPLHFFADQLRVSLLSQGQGVSQTSDDIYLLSSTLSKIMHAHRLERAARTSTDLRLEEIRESIRQAQFDRAIGLIREVKCLELSESHVWELLGLAERAAESVGQAELALEARTRCTVPVLPGAAGLTHTGGDDANRAEVVRSGACLA